MTNFKVIAGIDMGTKDFGCVSVDPADSEYPICVDGEVADGWMSVADAKQLLADLGRAVSYLEKPTK